MAEPPDPRLVDAVGWARCLSGGFVPWRTLGGGTVVAVSRPDAFDPDAMPRAFGPCRVALATEAAVAGALTGLRDREMARAAETRVPAHLSARTRRRLLLPAACAGAALVLWIRHDPAGPAIALALWAILTLVLSTLLRLACSLLHLRPRAPLPIDPGAPLPTISVLVPLYDERRVLRDLAARLARLDYPPDRLDVLLVVEEDDAATRRALRDLRPPHWMRIVVVPAAPLRTKPRALNYALPFARGSIVGVWDAEDAPEPGQLRAVAARFAAAPPEVVCLQGVLDFYNPRVNWLSRCFAIEYAAWFRVILPGLERLGLAVPLGGTTIFLRRAALESLGGWDAHNVTEDADLGMRIARRGWRTELAPTVTLEEANCAARPWVVQRSRWLKGYAVTWAVHMRDPVALWRDLGAWRFAGFQVLFLCTLSQFLLAPLLWTFWLALLGAPHFMDPLLGGAGSTALATCFLGSEVVLLCVSGQALARREHRHLIPWVPMLHLYFPLGAIAAWRGLWEVAARPFHWHKTAHGAFTEPAELHVPGTRPPAALAPSRPAA